MEYNQLKQYGTTIHEDTPNTSTPVACMIPSTIDAKYAKLFLAAPIGYELAEAVLDFNPFYRSDYLKIRAIAKKFMDKYKEA